MALLNNMPTSRLFSLISAGLLVFTFIAVGGLWWPKYQSFDVSVKSLDQKNQEIKQKEEYFATLRDSETQLGDYTEQLAKIDTAFPSNFADGLGSFVSFLYSVASQNGVLINKVGWRAEEDKTSGLIKVTFDNSGLAPYEKVKGFIDQLYRNTRLVSLGSFEITRGESNESISSGSAQSVSFSLIINFNRNPQSAVSDVLKNN